MLLSNWSDQGLLNLHSIDGRTGVAIGINNMTTKGGYARSICELGVVFFYENKTVKCFLLPQMFYSLLGYLACLMAWMFLVEGLDKTCTRYKMEISAEKTKLMTNSDNGIQREIKVKGQKLGTVTSSKYLGAVVSDDGMMAPNQRFSQGLHKPRQLLQS